MFVWLSIASQSSKTFAVFLSGQSSSTGMTMPAGATARTVAFAGTAAGVFDLTVFAFDLTVFAFAMDLGLFRLGIELERCNSAMVFSTHGQVNKKTPPKTR